MFQLMFSFTLCINEGINELLQSTGESRLYAGVGWDRYHTGSQARVSVLSKTEESFKSRSLAGYMRSKNFDRCASIHVKNLVLIFIG